MLAEIIVAIGLTIVGLIQFIFGGINRNIGWLFIIAAILVSLIVWYGSV
jgi:hypothetical protein